MSIPSSLPLPAVTRFLLACALLGCLALPLEARAQTCGAGYQACGSMCMPAGSECCADLGHDGWSCPAEWQCVVCSDELECTRSGMCNHDESGNWCGEEGAPTIVACGGDTCACSDPCTVGADCNGGCCTGGFCLPSCACEQSVALGFCGTGNPKTLGGLATAACSIGGPSGAGPWMLGGLLLVAAALSRRRLARLAALLGLIATACGPTPRDPPPEKRAVARPGEPARKQTAEVAPVPPTLPLRPPSTPRQK